MPPTENVLISNLVCTSDDQGFKIGTESLGDFRNITLNGTGPLINVSPWTQYEDLQGQPRPMHTVRNITLRDIKGTYGSFGQIRPNPGDVIEDITLENIDVTLTNPVPKFAGVCDA